MTPYYEHKGITIYHGDCREVATGDVDSVITDPPYLGARGESWETSRVPLNVPYAPASLDLLRWIATIGVNGWMVVFQDFKGMVAMRAELEDRDDILLCQVPVVWCKPAGAYCPNGSANSPAKSVDYIVAARRRGIWKSHKPGHYVSNPYSPKSEIFRTGGKPLSLMSAIVRDYSRPGDLVFDPFMGGGTTLVAARHLRRKAIGIDLEEKYCEIAAKRLEQEVMDFSAPEPRKTDEQLDLIGGAK